MYRSVIWPVMVVIVTGFLAWSTYASTSWGYVAVLLLVGLSLAGLGVGSRYLPARAINAGVIVVSLVSGGALLVSGTAFGDPLVAVPFLCALGGAVSLRAEGTRGRSISGTDPRAGEG